MYPIVYSGKWKTDLLHLHILQLHHLYWETLIIYLLYRSSVTSVQWILQPRQLHRFSNSLQENKRTYLPLFVFCPQKLRDRAKTSDCPVIPPPATQYICRSRDSQLLISEPEVPETLTNFIWPVFWFLIWELVQRSCLIVSKLFYYVTTVLIYLNYKADLQR